MSSPTPPILRLHEPLKQAPFLAWGVGLFALKIGCDFLIARGFGRPYSPLFYVSPMESPLLQPGGQLGYWFTMWAVAAPFIAIGLVLTIRRLRDAQLPPALAALFFVPFANLLFFAACALVPGQEEPRVGAPLRVGEERSEFVAVLMAGTAGAVVGLGAMGVSVEFLKAYGASLMVGAPAVAGFTTALVFARLRTPQVRGVLLASLVAFALSFIVMVAFALEGVVCLVMAFPLLGMLTLLGAAAGYGVTMASHTMPTARASAPLVTLPLLFLAERFQPLPEAPALPVESVVEVAASPDTVWKYVIAFPPLPPPTEAIFKAGVAAPMRATITGEGPGAIRRCEFTTGAFVEPIEIWNPGHELTFSVTSQPDPLRELTWRPGPRPPHLDGYLQTTRGQFLIEALPNGKTRLTGRTWYRTHLSPEPYWRAIADPVLHTVHLRVMNHVARLAEAEASGAR
jgi:uncharacterized membrane protein YhaH (DUF805 family)